MRLPGGLVECGTRRRDFAFRPLTGALELALAEIGETAPNTPQAVTQVLRLVLAQLCGEPPSAERVAALCVADRQFLMRELERHLGVGGGWFHGCCEQCGSDFDFHLDYAQLPVQEAEEGFPRAMLRHDGRTFAFRLPTGEDQESLLQLPPAEAPDWLLGQLAEDPDERLPEDPEFRAAAEAALDAMAPGIVLVVEAACPQCGKDNRVELDPYRALARSSDPLLHEVHQIAAHYHWSEGEILALPRTRRQHYLQLIDRARGVRGD